MRRPNWGAVAAWLTFTLCRQNSRDPVARCEKQYQAAKAALEAATIAYTQCLRGVPKAQ